MSSLHNRIEFDQLERSYERISLTDKRPPPIPRKSQSLRNGPPPRPRKSQELRGRPTVVHASTAPPALVEKPIWLRSLSRGTSGSASSDSDTPTIKITLVDNEGEIDLSNPPDLPPRPHSARTESRESSAGSDISTRPPTPSSRPERSLDRPTASRNRPIPPPKPQFSKGHNVQADSPEIRPSLPPRPISYPGPVTFDQQDQSVGGPPALPERPQPGNIFKDALSTAQNGISIAGTGLRSFGSTIESGVRKVGDNIQTPAVFAPLHDDLRDVHGRSVGGSGLCSRCESLSIGEYTTAAGPTYPESPRLNWVSPLARVIYHSSWCRICQLLLSMLCLPDNDPFEHSSVKSYLQEDLEGMSMSQWLESGLADSTGHETWPFGHGRDPTEGASNVLHPAGVYIGRVGKVAGSAAMRFGVMSAIGGRPGGMKQVNTAMRSANKSQRREYWEGGGANYPFHPLPCDVVITSGSKDDRLPPGTLRVRLLGFGRGPEATLTALSWFVLRAIGERSKNIFSAAGISRDMGTNPQTLNSTTPLSYGFSLDQGWVDSSFAGLCLQECESRHGPECSRHGWEMAIQKPTFLRVIDCRDMKVKRVSDPASCRYVALSYVWGKADITKLVYSNADELSSPGGLSRQTLPLTIRCAIQVVKDMGERYLWTDALCIMQEDVAEKYRGIKEMDRIYGGALATIVAAQGTSAIAGLEGIQVPEGDGKERIVYQSKAETKDGLLLAAPLATKDHGLDASVWNSRAWTFQERLLSRRLIVFSHGQVIWHCHGMICREDMPVKDSEIPYLSLRWLALKPRSFAKQNEDNWSDGSTVQTRHGNTTLVRSSTMAEYASIVEQYSSRQLSFDKDVINAFSGLGDIFVQAFRTTLLAGLPELHLDVSLLWKPTRRLKRRRGFPSWSWAGWIGRVSYEEPFQLERQVDGTFIGFKKFAFGQEGIRPLVRWFKHDVTSGLTPVNSTGLGFPWENEERLPREWDQGPYCHNDETGFSGPLTAGLRVDLEQAAKLPRPQPDLPRLVFWASYVPYPTLKLGLNAAKPSPERPSRYQLLSYDGDVEGNVLLDDATDPDRLARAAGRWGFVQLAEAKYFALQDENRDVHGCPLYVVMLVEWMDEARTACERRGLGRIAKGSWMLAKPKMRLVSLG